MKTKSAPASASQPPPLSSYVAEFEQWMRKSARCNKSNEAEDICQEIRLALWVMKDVPATLAEARLVFLRLASRFESRARRQVYHQGALVARPEELAGSIERDALRSLALFEAIEKLNDHEQWLIKECKIDGRTNLDVANQLGLSEETVRNRLWRAITQLFAAVKGDDDEKEHKSGALIVPLAFEFSDIQRAAFSAIWRAEGRVPTYGGPPGPPPPPPPPPTPPVVPVVPPPIFVAPAVSATTSAIIAAVTAAVLVVMLMVMSPSLVALNYFWKPPHLETATKGLHVPPIIEMVPPTREIEEVDDVIPIYAAPTASSSSASVRSPSSSPPIDPEDVKKARRRLPRFLPGRK